MKNPELQVRRDAFYTSRLVDIADTDLQLDDAQILLKVNKFAYTANNVTYAVAGDMIGYWQFFPPHGEDVKHWGVIPVWGFAEIVKSKVEGLVVGEKLFGYFPPAKFVKMQPVSITQKRFIDGSIHRSQLPIGYNIYRRLSNDERYNDAYDNQRMLLFPLHLTSFCLSDALGDMGWYDAQQIVILSASSKTSTGLAYALKEQTDSPSVIALTSSKNLDFVKNLKIYDESFTYVDFLKIDNSIPTVIVDMSGNTEVMKNLHTHLGDNMKFTLKVGITHWSKTQAQEGIIEERSKFFFAPSHIQKRIKDWGAEGFDEKTSGFLLRAADKTKEWLNFRTLDGLEELSNLHAEVCQGNIPANQGLIIQV